VGLCASHVPLCCHPVHVTDRALVVVSRVSAVLADSASEFRDNPLSWDQWLTEYAVPLWSSTMRMVFRFEEQSFLETRTVRFEDIRDDPRRALAPVLRLVGAGHRRAAAVASLRA
jgi:hypothetical protein